GSEARNEGAGRAGVTSVRRDASRAGEIGHVRSTMVIFPAEGDVLAGHVVEGRARIPCFKRISGTLCEVRCARECGGSIDRRQQHEVASGIVDLSSTQGDCIKVAVEPEAVVDHIAEEALLGATLAVSETAHTAAAFTASIGGEGKRHLVQIFLG